MWSATKMKILGIVGSKRRDRNSFLLMTLKLSLKKLKKRE